LFRRTRSRQHINSLRAEIKALHKKFDDTEAGSQSVSFKYEALIKTEAALRQDHFRALTEIERLGQIRKTQDADLKDTRDNLASANQECALLRAEIERLKQTSIDKADQSAAAVDPDDAIQKLMALDSTNTPKQNS
jgi:chromosome segregation ATPase